MLKTIKKRKPMDLNNHGSSSSTAAATILSPEDDYEVFLSFRGPDTRTGFTDHLYHSLKDAGVHVFRDDEELRVGEEISTNLIEAINKSNISLPIFSEGYASSKWCLNELVHIAGRRKSSDRHQVMPIFYKILPADVRNQSGSFRVSFDEHQRRFSKETVGEWKRALKEVGGLKGWEIKTGRSSEAEVIKEVVKTVLRQLKKSYVVVTDFVVGIEDRVENIKSIISADSGEDKIIGLHGPGGIGKTTLAKIVYNQLSNDFEGCSFLANVRETSDLKDTGIMRLQNQLISDILKSGASTVNSVDEGVATIKKRLSWKKVLICFDDVSERKQLESLVGNSSSFGPGSKIIITTRNKQLLNEVGAYSSYEVTEMDFDQSLQLFSKFAFRRDSPPSDYLTYSKRVVRKTGGLPLALEVIGSLLHGKAKDSWEFNLEKLEKVPHKDVQKSLMISYEELDDGQKQMFLDVSCFFVGFNKTTLLYFWDSDLYPREGMEVLEDMSLLKIKEDNIIWMHDQLIDFGRSITYKKGNVEKKNRSRLCMKCDVYSGQVEESVEAMMIWESHYECRLTRELFASVPNLKLLQVSHYCPPTTEESYFSWLKSTNSTVLTQLRWLSLHYLDPQLLRIKFSACNLAILDLSFSKVSHEWGGWRQIKVATSLKILNLSSCKELKRTPDLSAQVNLERLILSNCPNLREIHKSIGRLKRLVFLDLSKCYVLSQLPEEVGQLESLMELVLTESGVTDLPGSVGDMKSLKVLRLSGTAITELPASIGKAENLEEVFADGCSCLSEIPSEIGRLSSLVTLKISGLSSSINQSTKLPESLIYLHLVLYKCMSDDRLPDLSNLVNLRELDLKLSYHIEAPLWWIGRLSKLETLRLTAHYIPRLSAEHDLCSLSLLKSLHLEDCYNLQSLPRLPSSLLHLTIRNCAAITEIRGLPSSLAELHLSGCRSLKSIGDISNLRMLADLSVSGCAIIEIQQDLDLLENLQILRLEYLGTERLVSFPSNLKQLELNCCWRLKCLPRLPQELVELDISQCPIKMLDFSDLAELKVLRVWRCPLEETRGLHCLVKLSKFNDEFYSKPEPEFLQRELVGSQWTSRSQSTEEEQAALRDEILADTMTIPPGWPWEYFWESVRSRQEVGYPS